MICEGSVILRLHEVVCLKERGSVVMWRIADKEGPTGVMECPYCAEGKAYWVKEATYTMTHHDERVSGYMADCPYDIRAVEVLFEDMEHLFAPALRRAEKGGRSDA